jgi:hypothetical protein
MDVLWLLATDGTRSCADGKHICKRFLIKRILFRLCSQVSPRIARIYLYIQQHAQQFDPSQIAATPYSLQRLALYTGVTVLVAFSQHGWSVCKDWLILTIYTLGAMLLSGASTNTNLIHSVLAASYWTTLAFLLEPPFLSRLALFSFASSHLLSDDHSTSLQPSSLSSSSTRCSFYSPWLSKAISSVDLSSLVFHMTLAATIPLQILTLYDRGWQWQRWPVPMIVGSTCGWALGTMLAAWKQVFPAISSK